MISEGKTFLVPSGPRGNHFFFVILGPIKAPGYGSDSQFVSVNATALKDGHPFDDACVLEPGDHPFIKHKRYIPYRHARLDSYMNLKNLVNKGVLIPNVDCSPDLLQRIIDGATKSHHFYREFKRLFYPTSNV